MLNPNWLIAYLFVGAQKKVEYIHPTNRGHLQVPDQPIFPMSFHVIPIRYRPIVCWWQGEDAAALDEAQRALHEASLDTFKLVKCYGSQMVTW